MEKLKGVKDLERVINNFVEQFDCVASLSDDFSVSLSNNHIYFSLFCTEADELDFMKSVNRCQPKVKMDIFMWSLLHEIFHVETYEDLTDEEIIYSNDTKQMIKIGLVDPLEYYDLPIERFATEGAVEYANTHIDYLRDVWTKQIQPAIENFYKANNIIDFS